MPAATIHHPRATVGRCLRMPTMNMARHPTLTTVYSASWARPAGMKVQMRTAPLPRSDAAARAQRCGDGSPTQPRRLDLGTELRHSFGPIRLRRVSGPSRWLYAKSPAVGRGFSITLSALQGEHSRPVGQKRVVDAVGAGRASLVEQLQVAGVDGHGLVRTGPDQLAVADVVGPGGTAVGLAGEGVALARGLRRPGAAEAGGGERAEVAAVGPIASTIIRYWSRPWTL